MLFLATYALFCTVHNYSASAQSGELHIDWTKALYVSPSGNDKAAGTHDKPFATIKRAVKALPASGGGVIALMDGEYNELVQLQPPADGSEPQRLTIIAAPGAKPVLQGGVPVTKWESYRGEKRMYVFKSPTDRSPFTGIFRTYIDVWENTARVRYRIQMDPAGVHAYPGSACWLDDTRILVHTRNGQDPRTVNLWSNSLHEGLIILRDNVEVRGIHFENYLGGVDARAVLVGHGSKQGYKGYKGIFFADCTIANCVNGLTIDASAPRVQNCDIREVGMGIMSHGDDMTVKDCVIQSAVGPFAIPNLNQHARNGIRYYYDSNGGTVTGCVTAGFFTGLYIKSNTNGPDTHPTLIKNNIFIDGIRPGVGTYQPKSTYLCNIIGPNQDFIDTTMFELLKPSTMENNYLFAGGGSSKGTNVAGDNPFIDMAGGNLGLRPNVKLPSCAAETIKNAIPVKWTAHLAEELAHSYGPKETSSQTLQFTHSVIASRSSYGALVSTYLSQSAQGILYYRKVGTSEWHMLKGIDNTLTQPKIIYGTAPIFERKKPEYGVLFVLSGSQLEANTDYEYYVEATADGQPAVRSTPEVMQAGGKPKVMIVRADSDATQADGTSQHPFPQLQAAFDRALPGDTIRVEEGVYTEPALLVHGGTDEAPVIIEGAGAETTILDGGKISPIMLELRNMKHVIIRDIQARWVANACIFASKTENVTVERCRFFNSTLTNGDFNAQGILLLDSPHWTISHNLFSRFETGAVAVRSSYLKLLNNTTFKNLYNGVALTASATGSIITGNSFTFTGNDSITFQEKDMASFKKAFATLTCDYNNYGTWVRPTPPGEQRPENDFKPAPRYGGLNASKAIVRVTIDGSEHHRFNRMDHWREFSGVDAHSILLDPQYVDPQKVDFRLMPNSPNMLSDNKIIGAYPVATALNSPGGK